MAINMMCMNTECKHYWEDNCMKNLDEERIEIDADGKCTTFEKGTNELYKQSILKAKLKKATAGWHMYLEGKTLIVGEIDGSYNLLSIFGEKNGISNLYEFVYDNCKDLYKELGYKSLKDYIAECKIGNDGFGFDKDEIELLKEGKSIE